MSRSIFTIVLTLLLFGGVSAGIIKVPENHATIQAGIDAAVKGDTVLVAVGSYYENIDFKGKAITITSYFYVEGDTDYINSTIIDGSRPSDPNKGSVVSFTSGEDTTSVICGFTITGGTGTIYDAATRVGGGIYCKISGARISHNKIVFNTVNHSADCDGGGIGYWPQTNSIARYVIIEDNVVESNSITSLNGESYLNGGGVHIAKGKVTGNIIRFNSVSGQPRFAGGGGISAVCEDYANRTLVVITGNTITHNKVNTPGYAGGWGGGVDVVFCNVQIINNTISHNKAGGTRGVGAGIRLWGSKEISLIKDNIISFNSVDTRGWGGGIFSWNSTIINNIIVENEARVGGGIYCWHDASVTTPNVTQIINNTITGNMADTAGAISINTTNTVIMNTICWGNTAPHGPEIEMWGGTLNAAYSDIQLGANSIAIDSAATVNWLAGNIDANPLFAFPDHKLSNSSPCIGAGIEAIQIGGTVYNCPNTDIEGNPRPDPTESTTPDIGAYEHPLDKPSGLILVPEQYASIQAGINASKDGDMVLVADGTYIENINFKGKAITVASHYLMDGDTTHVNNTIIDGSKPSHPDSGSVVFFISGEDTTSVLCGFTITGGSGTETSFIVEGTPDSCRGGGGIFCYNSVARILNNKIINNAVNSLNKHVNGGGLVALPFGSNAWLVLKENQISHNTLKTSMGAAVGGGLEIGCNIMLVNNVISFNTIVYYANNNNSVGGGFDISTYSSDLRIIIVESNKIAHNSIMSYGNIVDYPTAVGGGVSIWGRYHGRFAKNEVSQNELWINSEKNGCGAGMLIGEVTELFIIEGNIFKENAITNGNGWGGGIDIVNCSPCLTNNIIAGNSATNGGGFLIGGENTVKLINNTVVNNKASYGGAIYVSGSNPVLMNSIIWNNQAPTHAAIHIGSGTVRAAYCDIQGGWSGTMNINADPLFVAGSWQLSDKSPCLNVGVASFDFGSGMMCYCPKTDIAGNPRPYPAGGKPDIGAYELMETKVNDLYQTEIPQSYSLAQNYPNPFNPSTTIEFALPKSAFVTLKVYNLLGEEVITLIAEQRSAGLYKLNWDARGLASGVYLYRLEAGEFVQTRKLILMR